MSPDELATWLQLLETPGIGRLSARRLLAAFGGPQAVLAAHRSARAAVVGATVAAALDAPPEGHAALVERTQQWRAESPLNRLLALGDADYPAPWLHLSDPPLLMYARGRLDLLQRPAVAMVGSRNPTPQGLLNARSFAAALSREGVTVVSGLAQGIDGAAHEGALDGPGGSIAFVGTGLDRVYPRSHLALARRLSEHGLLLSEYPLGTAPLPGNFPQRNRLIAAQGAGTLVVEATLQSGSLITARLAAEIGREVFAIPGDIHNPQSRGCHALIRQGAKLVESMQDVLEELHLAVPASPGLPPLRARAAPVASASAAAPAPEASLFSTPADADDDPVLQALGWSPATLDVLQLRTGWSVTDLSVRLLELELSGQVIQQPGQLFSRLAQA
jgi:DNA processing protein